ncbi:MAG: hypothetical protein WCR58_07145 [Bacteroidales bacterium]|nr:hypothetical protein [Bacteroidales bacterium]MDD3702039.1 hypothetical protein [Bacteroidales bacterium]MDY0369714.1 hypothetical protein [Bacteroidales bacterium]
MTGIWIALLFIVWYALALFISEKLHTRCRAGKQWLFFFGMIGSPLLSWIIVLVFPKKI